MTKWQRRRPPATGGPAAGDGTRWVLTTMGTPTGVAVSPTGAVYYADGAWNAVRVIEPGASAS